MLHPLRGVSVIEPSSIPTITAFNRPRPKTQHLGTERGKPTHPHNSTALKAVTRTTYFKSTRLTLPTAPRAHSIPPLCTHPRGFGCIAGHAGGAARIAAGELRAFRSRLSRHVRGVGRGGVEEQDWMGNEMGGASDPRVFWRERYLSSRLRTKKCIFSRKVN
jgi:hypothetical protein